MVSQDDDDDADLSDAVPETATLAADNIKEPVHTGLCAKGQLLLAGHDYPPDMEERSVELIWQQPPLSAGAV